MATSSTRYSTYGRGLDILVNAYNFFDLAPKGRDEDGLEFSMSWVRTTTATSTASLADPTRPYGPTQKPDPACCSHDGQA